MKDNLEEKETIPGCEKIFGHKIISGHENSLRKTGHPDHTIQPRRVQ